MGINARFPPVLVEGSVSAELSLRGPSREGMAGFLRDRPCPFVENFPESMVGLASWITFDAVHIPMTCLAAYHRFGLDLTKKNIVIYLVGGEMQELMRIGASWEELFHWLPECKKLTVVYVGPFIQEMETVENPCCPSCVADGRRRFQVMKNKLLQDVFHELPRPDLAIACNAGIHDRAAYPDWEEAVELLLEEEIPCVFTSYTAEESMLDCHVVEELGGRFKWGWEKNPWRSPIALLDPEDETLPFYSSHYWYGFQGVEKPN
jgi:splicing suppressor protein 51